MPTCGHSDWFVQLAQKFQHSSTLLYRREFLCSFLVEQYSFVLLYNILVVPSSIDEHLDYSYLSSTKNHASEAGEMAQLLRALVPLAENVGLGPSNHLVIHNNL